MNGILIIPSSPNGDTIENILRIVFDQQSIVDNSLPCVDKVTFLESGNLTGMKLHGTSYSLASGYEEIFLRLNLAHIECRRRKINKYAEEIPSIIMSAIREVGRENIILDLTSGKKDITGSLYTAATICNISNMIYVEVLRRSDNCFYVLANEDNIQSKYTLTKFQSLDALENLASQNCMEFVIYKKSVSQINEGRTSQLLELFCSHLNNAIDYYFNGSSIALMQSIRNIGSINEQLIGLISRALCSKFNHLASNNIPSGVFGPISYALSAFSKTLTNHINSLHRYILACEGIVYLAGGDNILALVPSQHITQVIKETRSLEDNGITFSIGIGQTAVAAYLALKYAKSIVSSDPVYCSDHTFSPYHNPIDPSNIN